MGTFKDLAIYKKSFAVAMDIFSVSASFPKEERYSLTDQIRRSSRSVSVNLGEGYRKRIYRKHFIAKLTDSDMENLETSIWLDFALACGYINEAQHKDLLERNEEVGRMLGHMLQFPEKYGS